MDHLLFATRLLSMAAGFIIILGVLLAFVNMALD